MTPEIKRDLKILSVRQHLDPKRFYKKDSGRLKYPKYFQVSVWRAL